MEGKLENTHFKKGPIILTPEAAAQLTKGLKAIDNLANLLGIDIGQPKDDNNYIEKPSLEEIRSWRDATPTKEEITEFKKKWANAIPDQAIRQDI